MSAQAQSRTRYARRPHVILINGLAEQTESWYCNLECWRRTFDVHMPQFVTYDGDLVHRRIAEGLPIDVAFIVEQLSNYVDSFVQCGPIHLVANSMGGKVAVEFAARHPQLVARLVLLCPSGLCADERLPVLEGVRRSDLRSVVHSVFHDDRHADDDLYAFYRDRFVSRKWRTGLLRTIRGTMDHRVVDLLPSIRAETLLLVGKEDRIVDPEEAAEVGKRIPRGRVVVLPECGHAPQVEKADLVNSIVAKFLSDGDVPEEAACFVEDAALV